MSCQGWPWTNKPYDSFNTWRSKLYDPFNIWRPRAHSIEHVNMPYVEHVNIWRPRVNIWRPRAHSIEHVKAQPPTHQSLQIHGGPTPEEHPSLLHPLRYRKELCCGLVRQRRHLRHARRLHTSHHLHARRLHARRLLRPRCLLRARCLQTGAAASLPERYGDSHAWATPEMAMRIISPRCRRARVGACGA